MSYWFQHLDLPFKPVRTARNSIYFDGVFRCPLNKGRQEQEFGSTEVYMEQQPLAYGYNAWGVGHLGHSFGLGGQAGFPINKTPAVTNTTRESSVIAPSRMIALGDLFSRSINPLYDGAQPGADNGALFGPSAVAHAVSIFSLPQKKHPSFKLHRGRMNHAYADGHLEVEDMRRPFYPSDPELARWNIDHQPHRDRLRE
jgi:prepilin-type processing-associated H-X9-DG protein